jgi:hypothetical protein
MLQFLHGVNTPQYTRNTDFFIISATKNISRSARSGTYLVYKTADALRRNEDAVGPFLFTKIYLIVISL